MEAKSKETIEHIIHQLRPQLQADGGDIRLVEIRDDNVVMVELQGACGSCPHSKMTLKNGVESILKQYVPEVDRVEDINLHF
ncbi:MAG: NifU family protein [Bacteroidales bacterium]|mgnify:CR=1 FL=1|jgi:Fe-S cluster biogenesis protein NfuA|nr:NifU family protein [Bacteroidales bacterium]MBO7346045.1 NifU family protein [Bacteroidales bacterium]MBQ4477112.1 NifU family protein [Bacteroidales bacterium]MBR4453759.1 NifU family protein [Bacteroidales bacterium]MCR5555913.1 NifU family protein [Bacteroidales bacterium]